MRIGGLQKLSLIDYPGKPAAVVFTQGCNFRCPFCHNRALVLPECYQSPLSCREVLQFLSERREKLQGVVVTGGEPTLHKGLVPFLEDVKHLGYAVKLDTNGSRPQMLEHLIEEKQVDFIAMDVKGPWERYDELAGVSVNLEDIRESVRIILDSGVEHLFRTTVIKPLLSEEDVGKTAGQVRQSRRYLLQEFVPAEEVLNPDLLDRGHYTQEEFSRMQHEWQRELVEN